MKGHLRQRGKDSWELKVDAGRDPVTKRRITRYATVRGTKKDAQRELTGLLHSIHKSTFVAPRKITLAEHLTARIEHWRASGRIGARTAEHYQTLADGIVRHFGDMPLQKITTLDIEAWHRAMHSRGVTRSASAAHTLLARALTDALKHKLVSCNPARDWGPPATKPAAPMPILRSEEIPALLARWTPPGCAGDLDAVHGHPARRDVGLALARD